MVAVHVAATVRRPVPGLAIVGELTFPTDLVAITHRLTRRRGAAARFLIAEAATRANLVAAVGAAAGQLVSGVFVLAFAGHGGQTAARGATRTLWQLHDGELHDDELGGLLAGFAPAVHVVVIADCCNARGMIEGLGAARGPTALIAATAADQAKVNTPRTQFGQVLEDLLGPGPAPTYRALDAQLAVATPISERASVWCSTAATSALPALG